MRAATQRLPKPKKTKSNVNLANTPTSPSGFGGGGGGGGCLSVDRVLRETRHAPAASRRRAVLLLTRNAARRLRRLRRCAERGLLRIRVGCSAPLAFTGGPALLLGRAVRASPVLGDERGETTASLSCRRRSHFGHRLPPPRASASASMQPPRCASPGWRSAVRRCENVARLRAKYMRRRRLRRGTLGHSTAVARGAASARGLRKSRRYTTRAAAASTAAAKQQQTTTVAAIAKTRTWTALRVFLSSPSSASMTSAGRWVLHASGKAEMLAAVMSCPSSPSWSSRHVHASWQKHSPRSFKSTASRTSGCASTQKVRQSSKVAASPTR